MKNLLLAIVLLTVSISLHGQAGVFVYAGPAVGFTADEVVSPKSIHYGYTVGVNGRFNSDNIYFLMGAEYMSLDMVGDKSINISSGDDVTFINYKVGVGTDLVRFDDRKRLRAKVQGNFMTLQSVNGDYPTEPGYNALNDTATLGLGLGYTRGKWAIDFEYNIGLFNLYSQQKDSAMSIVALTSGVKF